MGVAVEYWDQPEYCTDDERAICRRLAGMESDRRFGGEPYGVWTPEGMRYLVSGDVRPLWCSFLSWVRMAARTMGSVE